MQVPGFLGVACAIREEFDEHGLSTLHVLRNVGKIGHVVIDHDLLIG